MLHPLDRREIERETKEKEASKKYLTYFGILVLVFVGGTFLIALMMADKLG